MNTSTRESHPDADARFCTIQWAGPFDYGTEGLSPSRRWPGAPLEDDMMKLLDKAGLYIVLGDSPLLGSRVLLYIGSTEKLERRLGEHDPWISKEWNVEVYLGIAEKKYLRKECEKLLIYAHSPHYNSDHIQDLKIRPLRIWNVGQFWGLYPEVSSKHPWNVE